MEAAALTQCAPGCWAFTQPPGGWFLNNAGLIPGRRRALVVDSLATAALERDFLVRTQPIIRLETGLIVVNTHSHADHVYGNALLPPSAIVVAHPVAAAEITRIGLALAFDTPQVEWGDIAIRTPDVMVADQIEVDLGDTTVSVLHLGPGHTRGDLVVWHEATRTLYSGDLVMSQVTPFFLSGSPLAARATLERLRSLRPVTIVPGHGVVGGPGLLEANITYLDELLRTAAELACSSLAPHQIRSHPGIVVPSGWVDPERHFVNLYAALCDLSPEIYGAQVDHRVAMELLGPMRLDPRLTVKSDL
ncbi:MAG: MBL fold metallo-hydrolase [Propionibacteriaceae bacterium]|jgi:cyclase|nr:MBL fold metallo-hydrolase [Propionibacteriaceae bacterium]